MERDRLPDERVAQLVVAPDGRLVATAEVVVTDEMIFDAIESGRR